MREMSGEVGENRARLISFINKQNIELVFTENIAPALGMSYGGRIAILPGQSEAEEFSALVHELAHEMLEPAKRRTTTTKVVRETEAKSIAFVVGKAVGLNTGTASAERSGLNYNDVEIPLIWLPHDIPSETAEYRPATGNRIFAINRPPSGINGAVTNAFMSKN
jgi:hypothetical protein